MLPLATPAVPVWMTAGPVAVGAAVGFVGTVAGFRAIGFPGGRWRWFGALVGGLAAFAVAAAFATNPTPEVQPSEVGTAVRLFVLAGLCGLLSATVMTDLRDYAIPDRLTLPGTAAFLLAALASGDSQVTHLFVDWTQAIPQVRGPFIPQWIKDHPHWHGLAWSGAGAATGFLSVMAVRGIAKAALGRDALGSGDATLMMLAGAAVGWQATLTAVLVAPLFCVVGVPLSKLATGRSFVAYGPYLAAATVAVLVLWRPLWLGWVQDENAVDEGLRAVFSDPVQVGFILAMLFGGTALLLGLLRAFRSIPVRPARRAEADTNGAEAVESDRGEHLRD